MDPRITAAINIALDLFAAGSEIFAVLKGKDKLTVEELEAIIDKQNERTAKARASLIEAIGK